MISKKTAGKSRLLALMMCVCIGMTTFGCSKKDSEETSKKSKKTKKTDAGITEIETEESDPENTDEVTEKKEEPAASSDADESEAVSETEETTETSTTETTEPDEVHPREKASFDEYLPYGLSPLAKSYLTTEQQDLFYRFCEAVLNEESAFPCDNYSDFELVFYMVSLVFFPYGYAVVEMPEAYDVKNGMAQLHYRGTKEWREEYYRVLEGSVEELLSNVLSPEYSDFENALALYAYFVDNYVYDESVLEEEYTIGAYRSLVWKKGICQNFAYAYAFVLLQAGCDVDILSGSSMQDVSSAHVWNMIRLDGKCYMIDSTWGLGRSDLGHFLMTTKERTRDDTIFTGKIFVGTIYRPYEGEYLCEDETYFGLHEGSAYTWDPQGKVIYYSVNNDDGTFNEMREFHYT